MSDLTDGAHIERELMLIKVKAVDGDARDEVKRLSEIFRGNILDVTKTSYTIEVTGTAGKLNAFIEAIRDGMILEVARTGVSGVSRGEKGLQL